jgi:hypothetical protein
MGFKTIYQGPSGLRCSRLLHKTSLVITNRTVEIEREGANAYLTALTCGCWYLCFQTASFEIFELQEIHTLYFNDGIIVGEVQLPERCDWCSSRCGFTIDAPKDAAKSTRDIFFELKEAWSVARHSMLLPEDNGEGGAGSELLVIE